MDQIYIPFCWTWKTFSFAGLKDLPLGWIWKTFPLVGLEIPSHWLDLKDLLFGWIWMNFPLVGPSHWLDVSLNVVFWSNTSWFHFTYDLSIAFHCFQAHWQWIFSGQNKIEKKDKPILLQMMRKLVYSETQEDFRNNLEDMSSNPAFLKYPNYSKHMHENILQILS